MAYVEGYFDDCLPVVVYLAMSPEQAIEEKACRCLTPMLPDSKRVYCELEKLPGNLITVIKKGWEVEIRFKKKDAERVFELLYPYGTDFDYLTLINEIHGDEVALMGFGD